MLSTFLVSFFGWFFLFIGFGGVWTFGARVLIRVYIVFPFIGSFIGLTSSGSIVTISMNDFKQTIGCVWGVLPQRSFMKVQLCWSNLWQSTKGEPRSMPSFLYSLKSMGFFKFKQLRLKMVFCLFDDILDMKWVKNRFTSYEFHDILVKKL